MYKWQQSVLWRKGLGAVDQLLKWLEIKMVLKVWKKASPQYPTHNFPAKLVLRGGEWDFFKALQVWNLLREHTHIETW